MTQMVSARRGETTDAMLRVAGAEGLDPERVREEVSKGRMVIPANTRRGDSHLIGIGIAGRCKVNANIGTSSVRGSVDEEVAKLRVAVEVGADTVMDLSTGGEIDRVRQAILEQSSVPVGTVPIYQAVDGLERVEDLTADLLLRTIEGQAAQGVDYMTVHCGVLHEFLPFVARRLMGIVSRGGSIIARWMMHHRAENPLYEYYDAILAIARRYDVTLSLGDGLRPGCLADASDRAQFAELEVLGDLTRRAWDAGVQVMVEGPGHIPMHEVKMNVEREIEICHGAPFYVLGPIVTDIAPGYDHITSAIGAALAGWAGASMICYVTPMEHLGLPGADDVRDGVVAARIAAHAADIARGRAGARERDDAISRARYRFDWEEQFRTALDPDRARRMHDESFAGESLQTADYCSMCGPRFCSMRLGRLHADAQEETTGPGRSLP